MAKELERGMSALHGETNADELRLRFQQRAADALSTSSPTVSANIRFKYGTALLQGESKVKTEMRERRVLQLKMCIGCGAPFAPHWEEHYQTLQEGQPAGQELDQSSIVHVCQRCSRKTVVAPKKQPSKHEAMARANRKTTTALQAVEPAVTIAKSKDVVKSANATSKQRQRSRKGGLQAMLEKSKTSASSGHGLDLMDFMQ